MAAAMGLAMASTSSSAYEITLSIAGTNGALMTWMQNGGTAIQNNSYPYYGDPT
jgi:hypothetical protein